MTIDSNILGGKKAVNWEGIFKTGIPLSTYFTKRSPEAIQMHASDLPEKIRSLNKTSPMNILPRLGATKSPRGPQNSQRNKRYFFAFFRPAKASAKRVRSARHARLEKAFLRLPLSRVSQARRRSLLASLA